MLTGRIHCQIKAHTGRAAAAAAAAERSMDAVTGTSAPQSGSEPHCSTSQALAVQPSISRTHGAAGAHALPGHENSHPGTPAVWPRGLPISQGKRQARRESSSWSLEVQS